MIYNSRNVPDRVLEKHLRDEHAKGTSWLEDHKDDLRSGHESHHRSGFADHDVDVKLKD